MSDFSVNYGILTKEVNEINLRQKELLAEKQRIEGIEKSLCQMIVYNSVCATLKTVISELETELDNIKKLSHTLNCISTYYKNTENTIYNNQSNESISNSTNDSTNNNNNNNDDDNFAEQFDKLMESVNNYMNAFESKYDDIIQAIQDANEIDGVVAIGLSGSLGTGLYLCGSVQLVVDMDGNIGLQFSGGTGGEVGASADGTAYVAVYPGMESIYDVEGFGTDIGGSFGEGLIGSAGLLSAGEGNDMKPVGGYAGIGIGGEGTIAEGHVSMSQTFPTIPLGNIYTNKIDAITNTWDMTYNTWEAIYHRNH